MKFTKKIILFTLASQTEIFAKKEGFGYVPYNFLYSRLALPKSTIRAAILELVSDEFVEKISRNKRPFFKLTSLGEKQLYLFLPAIFKPLSWYGRWWLALLLGKGEKNIKIKHFLEERGLILLRSGVYIGFEDVSKELIAEGWGRAVFVTSFTKTEPWNNRELASKLWNLEGKGNRCTELIAQGKNLLGKLKEKNRKLDQLKLEVFTWFKGAFHLLCNLPSLPSQLVPDDWPLERLKKTIFRLSNALDNAERF